MTILVCGMCVVDFLFEVDELPNAGMKYVANKASRVAGGGALNAAIAISRLGGQASLVARIGSDWAGEFIQQVLADEHIDAQLLVSATVAETSYSAVMVDADGERQIINFRGNNLPTLAPDLNSLSSTTSVVSAALSDTRWEEGGVAILEKATEAGKPAVVDAEAPLCHAMLMKASHIAFSIQGLQDFDPSLDPASLPSIAETLSRARQHYSAWVCVTDGENGVYALTADSETIPSHACNCGDPVANNAGEDSRGETLSDGLALCHHAAYRVETIDTLGAGDVWHGAFTWHLAQQGSEHHAIDFANAAAALKCTQSGGGSSAPKLPEVEQFIQNSERCHDKAHAN